MTSAVDLLLVMMRKLVTVIKLGEGFFPHFLGGREGEVICVVEKKVC